MCNQNQNEIVESNSSSTNDNPGPSEYSNQHPNSSPHSHINHQNSTTPTAQVHSSFNSANSNHISPTTNNNNQPVGRVNSVSPITRPSNVNLASIHSLHPQSDLKLNSRFMLMPLNDQIRELQTVIRDRETSRGNFKFYADRLIRLVVEEGLNQLPIEKVDVKTPTGNVFKGIRYLKGNCGVSIVRSGESMEQGLRDCCRSIRIGKILIESDENNQARVLYAKFPRDIAERKILLLYPIMSTGLAVIESVKVLLNHGVKEDNLILLNLFSSPKASKIINNSFPRMFVLTSDINPVCPNHFGQRYFGTD